MQRNTGYFPTESLEPSGNRLFSRSALNEGDLFRGSLILHSDQGWQYQMKSYQNLLKAKGITQSMSRKATCLDNAVAENFFGLLKTELFYLEKFDSIDQLEKAIVDYIDYYNNRRIKLKLNGLSPVQYRIQTVGAA